MLVKYKIINKEIPTEAPTYATSGCSGVDLRASHDSYIEPGNRVLIGTNIAVELPEHYELQIRPRSGLALNKGITVLNSPGTVDCFSENMRISTKLGDKFVSEFNINDNVISYNVDNTDNMIEDDEIGAIIDKGQLEILIFECDEGILEVTPDTLVYTNNGLKYAKNVNSDDLLVYID